MGDLVDCTQTHVGKGRKVKGEIQRLSISCFHFKTKKVHWRCIVPGCTHFRAGNRQLSRILVHATECRHLSTELQDLANDTAITENAPGAKVNPQQIQADVEDQGPSYKKAKTVQNALTDIIVPAGKIKYEDEVNLCIVELIAVNGIPVTMLDSPQWKKLVEAMSKLKYNSPSTSTFVNKLIPGQAALVRKYQTQFLQTCDNLTLTFDGGSTRKPSSVYTIHITTAERETFFMEGCDATDERHTAKYIEGLVVKVSDQP